ncbi:hypothetical protein CEQ90_16570 [Lewinellaceae bacterium SD302]|nr:hypothetical protein CEQ90_16570 [Lewinellaceae bacterium SD302]
MAIPRTSPQVITLTRLTGSDQEAILKATKKLPDDAPAEGSSGYQEFVSQLKASPANVLSSLCSDLATRAGWDIETNANYQAFVNQFNGTPFTASTGGSPGQLEETLNVDEAANLADDILNAAHFPKEDRESVLASTDLIAAFPEEGRDEDLELILVSQIIDASDDQLTIIFTKLEVTISYKKGSGFGKKHKDHLKASGKFGKAIVGINVDMLEQSGVNFVNSLGYNKVTQWESDFTNLPRLTEEPADSDE